MFSKQLIGQDVVKVVIAQSEVLSQYFPGWAEEHHEKILSG
jgi:hypothetical protein